MADRAVRTGDAAAAAPDPTPKTIDAPKANIYRLNGIVAKPKLRSIWQVCSPGLVVILVS